MTANPKQGRAYEHVQRKLTVQERDALRSSLRTYGLRDPITIDQHGDILDGYNREDLCRELGIAAQYRTLEVVDPVHWIRHNQTARRNLGEAEMRELIVETKAADPTASTRSIAEKLGVNQSTVARTLSKSTDAGASVVNRVKGKDGKVRTYKAKPKNPATEAKLAAALNAYDRRKQAGEEITYDALMEEAGTSSMPVRRALSIRKGQEELGEQAEIILSASMQEKFEAKVRAIQKQMALEFETAVRAEAKRRDDEIGFPAYFKKLKEVEALLNSPRWAVMPTIHFKAILACLHPDNARPGHEDRFNEAFNIFNNYKPKLIDVSKEKEEKDRLKRIELRGAPLPRTVEEMMARKTMKRTRA
jgi:DNA-binding transcriptional regulator YhcF (GntR family)